MRAGKSSRAATAAAILGLIVLTVLMIDVFYTSNLLNPTAPRSSSPILTPPPPTNEPNGTLVISVTSNQNATNRFGPPTNMSSVAEGVPVFAALGDAINASLPGHFWTTNAQGLTGCIACLPAGPYIVSIQYDGVNVTIPAIVFAGNQTLVQVNLIGKAYPLTYTENSGILVTPDSAQYVMFAKVSSSAPVAEVNQSVFLATSEAASEVGNSVSATILSQGASTLGTQWLQLGTASPVNLYGATSISITAWTSSSTTTVGPVTYSASSLKP